MLESHPRYLYPSIEELKEEGIEIDYKSAKKILTLLAYDYYGDKLEEPVHKSVEFYKELINSFKFTSETPIERLKELNKELEALVNKEKPDGRDMERAITEMRSLIKYNSSKESSENEIENQAMITMSNQLEMPKLLIKHGSAAFLKGIGTMQNDRNFLKARSNKKTVTRMRKHSQITKVAKSAYADPLFKYKFATKKLRVRETCTSSKAMYIIIDDSGSMDTMEKRGFVFGILTDRMKQVIKDKNLSIYISWFEKEISYSKVIRNEKDAKAFLKKGFIGEFSGGTTDVLNVIKEASENIRKGFIDDIEITEKIEEILIINDGQDYVDSKYNPDLKTHAIMLQTFSHDLKKVVLRSGGSFHYIR